VCQRERENRLRALCGTRPHTEGYKGGCDQEQGEIETEGWTHTGMQVGQAADVSETSFGRKHPLSNYKHGQVDPRVFFRFFRPFFRFRRKVVKVKTRTPSTAGTLERIVPEVSVAQDKVFRAKASSLELQARPSRPPRLPPLVPLPEKSGQGDCIHPTPEPKPVYGRKHCREGSGWAEAPPLELQARPSRPPRLPPVLSLSEKSGQGECRNPKSCLALNPEP